MAVYKGMASSQWQRNSCPELKDRIPFPALEDVKVTQKYENGSWPTSSKDGSGLPPPEFCGTIGVAKRVLRKGLQSRKPAEPSHRTPKVLQNFGSQAQLFRPCKFFSHRLTLAHLHYVGPLWPLDSNFVVGRHRVRG